jgi:undecaprenyl diphosphate synthase
MMNYLFSRLPKHVGIIPDGNRRWAVRQGKGKEEGYECGLEPGLELYKLCRELGIPELTFYGFTHDNTKRPAIQKHAFQQACVKAVQMLADHDASLLVVGNHTSGSFPKELLPFINRKSFGQGGIKVNFLVNYDWQWDLYQASQSQLASGGNSRQLASTIASYDVSRVDLIVRWGGRRRLSGFLPVQSVYADFYVLDDYWPDFRPEQFIEALRWYEEQDVTLGG